MEVQKVQSTPIQYSSLQSKVSNKAIQPELSDTQLKSALSSINNSIKQLDNSLEFSIDKVTNNTVITLMDKVTNEVIVQIPSKEMLNLARRVDELQTGKLINHKA